MVRGPMHRVIAPAADAQGERRTTIRPAPDTMAYLCRQR